MRKWMAWSKCEIIGFKMFQFSKNGQKVNQWNDLWLIIFCNSQLDGAEQPYQMTVGNWIEDASFFL